VYNPITYYCTQKQKTKKEEEKKYKIKVAKAVNLQFLYLKKDSFLNEKDS